MKSKFTNQVQRHSPCLELCMDHAFGSCGKIHSSSFDAVSLHEVVKSVKELLPLKADLSFVFFVFAEVIRK